MKLFYIRLWFGLKKLVQRPLYNILVLLVAGATWFSLTKWDKLLALVHIQRPWLLPIGKHGVDLFILMDVSIVLLSTMALLGLIMGTATAFRASWTDKRVKAAFLSSKLSHDITVWPVLVYQGKKKEDTMEITEQIFYSPDVSLTRWTEAQTDILHNLNSHLAADMHHGGKDHERGYLIVLKTRPGIAPRPRETPTDPLFR